MTEHTVHPETLAGDPFPIAGARSCTCYAGVHYIGHIEHDEETGEEVEVIEAVLCRRCTRVPSSGAEEARRVRAESN